MLPSARELAQRHAAFCLKYDVRWRDCAPALDVAVRVAAALAGDRAEDEPAALLFALTIQPRALGDAWTVFPIIEARRFGRSYGLSLDVKVTDVELENLRLKLIQRRAQLLPGGVESLLLLGADDLADMAVRLGFLDLLAFLAARTRPLPVRLLK
jgi:hypothetical protein